MAVVTISRQFGAGGHTLGKLVADKLGYSFVDEEIIQRVAKKARVSTNWNSLLSTKLMRRLATAL